MNALNPLNMNTVIPNNSDKFKATKLWNEIVYAFFMGMPLQKHRRNMRSYYDCFVACEAIDWIHHYLQMNSHFAHHDISRFQAVNLLRKFLKSSIIEKVNARSNDYEFKDNKELYRFTRNANENLPFVMDFSINANHVNVDTPKLMTKNLQQSDKSLIKRQLSPSDISVLWKRVYLKHIITLIPQFDNFIKKEDINSLLLMHNMTRISKNGVVQLTDKSEDLPHWVMSAMKCLANWPNASGTGSCLPKYPGFEADVFNVIREYFVNLGIPLIPAQLYPLIISAFDAHLLHNTSDCEYHNRTLSRSKSELKNNFSDNFSPLSAFRNIEQKQQNDDQKTSTPLNSNPQQISTDMELPPNHVFETIFMSDSPVTKIVSIDELTELFYLKTKFPISRSFLNNSDGKGENRIRRSDSIGKLFTNDTGQNQEKGRYFYAVTTMPRKPKETKTKQLNCSSTIHSPLYSGNDRGYNNYGFAMQSPPEKGEYMMDKSVSSLSSSFYQTALSSHDDDDNLSARVAQSSTSSQSTKTNQQFNNLTVSVPNETIMALQLSLLLLPSSNRRQLHLLLRLLSKIIHNKEMCLFTDNRISIKQYLLETFTRSIICSTQETEYDELKCQRIVCLLIDQCKEIFKVPENVEMDAKKLIAENDINVRDESSPNGPIFCERITTEEFELQRDVLSHNALTELLRSIVTDDKLKDKQRLKLLKQFRVHHPDVYDLYFLSQITKSNGEQYYNDTITSSKGTLRPQKSNLFKFLLQL